MHRSLRGLAGLFPGLLLGLVLVATTACGQKGPLFMPPAESPAADEPSDTPAELPTETPTESPTEPPAEPDEDQAELEEE